MIDFPVYFDNAASTFPKPENVLSAVNRNLRSNTSNPGRSGHSLSFEAAERIFEAREVISEYFGCEPENVVYGTCSFSNAIFLAVIACILVFRRLPNSSFAFRTSFQRRSRYSVRHGA